MQNVKKTTFFHNFVCSRSIEVTVSRRVRLHEGPKASDSPRRGRRECRACHAAVIDAASPRL